MDIQKPKKALRSLFTKTEPDSNTSTDVYTDKKVLETVDKKIPISKNSAKTEQKKTTATAEPKKTSTIAKASVLLKEKGEIGIQESNHVIGAISNTSIDEDFLPEAPARELTEKTSSEPAPYSFVKIQYNLDLFKSERSNWKEDDYVSFLSRIDQAQTEAFFLKGKLVSEIKERFYLDNKKGWAHFCDETLNMNYTTANQYIRVAQEFDVTSHQRRDFGFEHFKALLPLSKTERNELLLHSPQNLSVKSLRDIVSKKLVSSPLYNLSEKKSLTAKNIVETLHKLKAQLSNLNQISLSQEEKWQLYGAFQNLSEDMTSISNSFLSSSDHPKTPAVLHPQEND
jgi:hypothetical protein